MEFSQAGPKEATARLVATAEVLIASGTVVAIDIPIGLMDSPGCGPRPADKAARGFLSDHNLDKITGVGSRVFPSPTREHLAILRAGGGYHDLLHHFSKGQHISKQCFAICPKIIELDDLSMSHPQAAIYEGHPEITFTHLAGHTLARKKSEPGAADRRNLLAERGFDIESLAASLPQSKKLWAMDDLLDACALALTARRIAQSQHRTLPSEPEKDSQGVRRVMHY